MIFISKNKKESRRDRHGDENGAGDLFRTVFLRRAGPEGEEAADRNRARRAPVPELEPEEEAEEGARAEEAPRYTERCRRLHGTGNRSEWRSSGPRQGLPSMLRGYG